MARHSAALAVLFTVTACHQDQERVPGVVSAQAPAQRVTPALPEASARMDWAPTTPVERSSLPAATTPPSVMSGVGRLGLKDGARDAVAKVLAEKKAGTSEAEAARHLGAPLNGRLGGELKSQMGNALGVGRGSGQALSGLGVTSYGMGAGGIGSSSIRSLGSIQAFGRGGGLGDSSSSGESYGADGINTWVQTQQDKLSTFSVDVDTASYTVARRKLLEGALPPTESVRVEEWLNYFRYHYPQPQGGPLSVILNAAPSPFSAGKHLLRVGVQGKQLAVHERKVAHLTFLVDVSGSMQSADKLPLAKRALRMLVDALRDGDTVALVTYAGAVRVVLAPTGVEKKAQIHAAIDALTASGSTAMSSGIELAYAQAAQTLDSQSVSRVIILSDGDANVGATSQQEILKLIAGKVKEGVFVTTVGFGMGNYKDQLMEQFADKGNGNHYYCDSLFEAKRIFVEQLGGTLEVIAQDVKLQVEFNPAQVKAYRLVGYENRDIADKDFRNDKVDAGEVGAGHSVTALYELELLPGAGEGLVTVRVRAKKPRGVEATEQAFAFPAAALVTRFDQAPEDFRFAAAVMGAAEIFRHSPHAAGWSYALVRELAKSATPRGNFEREEFLSLLEHAASIAAPLAAR